MKESAFIRDNKEGWQHLEDEIQKPRSKRGKADSATLQKLFTKVSDDLSYAQTYYPRRSVRKYLEQLTLALFTRIHALPVSKPGSFKRFWTQDLPLTFYEARKPLYVSFALFFLATLIGVFSTWQDPDFVRLIMGDGYVNMTEENIANGDPMAVYKDEHALFMFFRIFMNNLMVSVLTFVGGLTYGLGTVGILFSNGIMLGSFQFFFAQHDLLFASFLTVWQHGATEICGIVIAGGAGLSIAGSMIFPGSYPRMEALRAGVSRGLKMLLGIVPVIFFAAMVESFMTRFDEIHVVIRLITIILSFGFMIGYYVVLPLRLGRKAPNPIVYNPNPTPIPEPLKTQNILNAGEMLYESIRMLRLFGQKLWPILLLTGMLWGGLILLIYESSFETIAAFNTRGSSWFQVLSNALYLWWYKLLDFIMGFDFNRFGWLYPITILVMAALQFRLVIWFNDKIPFKSPSTNLKLGMTALFIHALFLAPGFWFNWWFYVYFPLLLPFGSVWLLAYQNHKDVLEAFNETFDAFSSQFLKYLILLVSTTLFAMVLMLLLQSPLLWIGLYLANSFIGLSEAGALKALDYLIAGMGYVIILCGLAAQWIAFWYFFLSNQELRKAHGLRSRLEAIQVTSSPWK
jgi:uncharacterized membrane protein SpoIIM required for sporulation